MNALIIFAAMFSLVLSLGLQQLSVSGGHRAIAMLTSSCIAVANLAVLKLVPGPTDWMDLLAYVTGGPLGILTSMAVHPRMVAVFGRRPA
jgi:hypothetical protein